MISRDDPCPPGMFVQLRQMDWTEMNKIPRFVLISCVQLGCIGCDQTTKLVATSVLENSPKTFLDDTVRLQLARNSGAFLGLGDSLPTFWKNTLFCFAISGFLFTLLVWTLRSKQLPSRVTIALALSVAGGLSNLFDRLRSGGYVVDFLNVGLGPIRTGIFNVADMAIMGGALILLVSLLRGGLTTE